MKVSGEKTGGKIEMVCWCLLQHWRRLSAAINAQPHYLLTEPTRISFGISIVTQ